MTKRKPGLRVIDPYRWELALHNTPELIIRAREAALNHAVSHREFHVGAAALIETEHDYDIVTGANFKPYKNGPKECAEQQLVRNASEHAAERILALVVTGPPQADHHSGLVLPTLHPCDNCRTMMYTHPLFDDETLILTVHPERDIYEIYDRNEVRTIHGVADTAEVSDSFRLVTDPGFAALKSSAMIFSSIARAVDPIEIPDTVKQLPVMLAAQA